ncbi:MAG: T9SS type A sorting domain-containing protein [Bacteroidetes bacterium]|nr:T9SS type A sorting domain-containing protein [Bacteroidota bacterium]
MKKVKISLMLIIAIVFFKQAFPQCTPMDSIACPDPENNGEVCPETLPGGIAGIAYESVATILPPPEVEFQPGVFIPLHHIKLTDVQNLPPGITYQSDSPDNIFLVGTYYCILLSGVPTVAGNYVLKIIVDIWAEGIGGGEPIWIAQQTDSTSLSIKIIWDPNAIDEPNDDSFHLDGCKPNPFIDRTRISFYSPDPAELSFDIYDLLGQIMYHQVFPAIRGENFIDLNGGRLPAGLYYYSISGAEKKLTKILIKTH